MSRPASRPADQTIPSPRRHPWRLTRPIGLRGLAPGRMPAGLRPSAGPRLPVGL
jgi:hypothetical protein